MPIIDLHTHPVFERTGGRPVEIKRLIANCRRLGIVRVNALGDVSAHGNQPTAAQLREINDQSGQLCHDYPDFFTAFCFLNPTLGETAVMREVERCVKRHDMRGIKLEKANNAAAPCMKHVARAAREFALPVLQHTWSTKATDGHRISRRFQSDPEDTATFARRNPDVTVIMAHLTGCGVRGVLEVKELPNVVVDTSGGYPEDGLVKYAVEQLGSTRVCYGSDIPIREHSVTLGRVLDAGLSATAQADVLHHNAARLLGLAQTESPSQ